MDTLKSIKKVTDYSDFNLYQMEVGYNYSLERIVKSKFTDDATLIRAILDESMPEGYNATKMDLGSFGCTAFKMLCTDDKINKLKMGRNYDFAQDTSGMLVYCPAIEGVRFASVGFAALNNIWANDPLAEGNVGALAAPFVCLDGMNEKGVTIAVLTLDSDPMRPTDTDKYTIATTLAIRMVLDEAQDAQDAVRLLSGYNMFASSGRDYHFFITDPSGIAIAVEYNLDEPRKFVGLETVPLASGERPPLQAMTNFFISYINEVDDDDEKQRKSENKKYGHGKERYNTVIDFMNEYKDNYTDKIAWEALMSTVQLPGKSITSNTQWSIMYNTTDKELKMVFRRHFEETWCYTLGSQEMSRGAGDEWMKEYYDDIHKNK